jgi:hypothetical protein
MVKQFYYSAFFDYLYFSHYLDYVFFIKNKRRVYAEYHFSAKNPSLR